LLPHIKLQLQTHLLKLLTQLRRTLFESGFGGIAHAFHNEQGVAAFIELELNGEFALIGGVSSITT